MLGITSRTFLAGLHALAYAPFVSFCSVGLGSYLRAHICHSYPGPLSCRLDLISLSLSSLFNVVVSFVLVSCLVVY